MKNGFIEEVGSEESQGKTNQNDKGVGTKNPFDKKRFLLAVSLGFNGVSYKHEKIKSEDSNLKLGPSLKFFSDYWLNKYFGLGIEIGYHNFVGSDEGRNDEAWQNEDNIFSSTYIKLGLPLRPNWRIFLNTGVGLYLANYKYCEPNNNCGWDTSLMYSAIFSLGWDVMISKLFEIGMILDYRWRKDISNNIGDYWEIESVSLSPFFGYVF